MAKHIAIIGAGIAGLSAAWYLHKKGFQITLIESKEGVAKACSYANGGQLSVCNSETWHLSRYLLKGISQLFNKQAPMSLLAGGLSLSKLNWLAEFVSHTLTNKQEFFSRQLIALGLQNRVLLKLLMEEVAIPMNYHKTGIINIFSNKKDWCRAQKICLKLEDSGWNKVPISVAEAIKLDPCINFDGAIGVTYAAEDSSADMYLFCLKLAKYLQKQGHSLDLNRKVIDIQAQGYQWQLHLDSRDNKENVQVFDSVVVAAGAYSSVLLKPFVYTNIYPVSGYSVTFDLAGLKEKPLLAILDESYKYAVSRLGNSLRVVGAAEWRGFSESIEQYRIEMMKKWVSYRYPSVATRNYQAWACMRPMTANMLPLIKQIQPNLYVSSGGGHLGWTTSLACGKKLADLMPS